MTRAWLGLALAGLMTLVAATPASSNHVVMHGGPFPGVVVALVPDSREPGTLYLAAFGSGVYKSVDGGRRWVAASHGLETPTVLTLAVDPGSPRTLYAGTDTGVFVSQDAAATWSRRGAALAARNVRSLLVPERSAVLYAATDQGVFQSPDRGRIWVPSGMGLDSRDIRVLRADPGHPHRLYAAGFGGVFRSEDAGQGWQSVSRGLTDSRVRALVVDSIRPGVLYAGTAGSGVFMTTDAGARWEAVNDGLGNRTVLSLAVTPRGERYAGTVGGVYRWDAAAAAWRRLGGDLLTLTVTFVVANPLRPATLYAGTGGLVFVSEDHGQRWEELAVSVVGPNIPRPEAAGMSRPTGTSSTGRR